MFSPPLQKLLELRLEDKKLHQERPSTFVMLVFTAEVEHDLASTVFFPAGLKNRAVNFTVLSKHLEVSGRHRALPLPTHVRTSWRSTRFGYVQGID